MKNLTEIRRVVEALIADESVSGYQLHKELGISQGAISELRNGKRKIDNLTFGTFEKLYNYAVEKNLPQ